MNLLDVLVIGRELGLKFGKKKSLNDTGTIGNLLVFTMGDLQGMNLGVSLSEGHFVELLDE